jgi:hypothetical protein
MKLLSYAYRFASNFLFLIMVYYSLNFLDKYNQRAIVAIMVLIYSAMRAASALRSFYFFQRIERPARGIRLRPSASSWSTRFPSYARPAR